MELPTICRTNSKIGQTGMLTSTWNNEQLSRLMLGTVQFGMPYGVANRTGQPSYPDVVAILAAAVEGGVNCFDTAAAYGTSEDVLGRALRELGIADRVTRDASSGIESH